MILTCFPLFLAVDSVYAVEAQLDQLGFELYLACKDPDYPDRLSMEQTLRGMMGRLPGNVSDARLLRLKADISVYLERLTARKQIFILHLPSEPVSLINVHFIRNKLTSLTVPAGDADALGTLVARPADSPR